MNAIMVHAFDLARRFMSAARQQEKIEQVPQGIDQRHDLWVVRGAGFLPLVAVAGNQDARAVAGLGSTATGLDHGSSGTRLCRVDGGARPLANSLAGPVAPLVFAGERCNGRRS